MLTRSDLHDYQNYGVDHVSRHRKLALWIGLGLGKSIISLTAFSDLRDAFEVKKALVVAPLRVALNTWPTEINKWDHVSHLRISTIIGTPKQRQRALAAEADIYVVNLENVTWLENEIGLRGELPWDMMILDESSAFKNRDTMRFKSMSRLARRADRLLQLTATPAPNSYVEVWPQMYLLDQGYRLGPSLTQYKQRYFQAVDREGRKLVLKKGAKEVIEDKIKDITVTMKTRDYLDMPTQLPPIDVVVNLSEDERALYEQMEREFVLEVSDTEIEAISASALSTKLAQLANGRIYDADKNVHVVHDAKIAALRELVFEAGDEPLLVSYAYQSERDAILEAFPQAEALSKDPKQIERWNRGEIPMLVVHPASAGHGLNLQHGGSILIFYGLTWSLELYLQLIGRLDRQGQTKPVRVYRLITEGTIDEDFVKVLSGKEQRQDALLEAMKRRVGALIDLAPSGQ